MTRCRVAVVATGLGLAGLVAVLAGLPGADILQLVGISFGVALLAYGAAMVALRTLQRSGREPSLPVRAVIVALIPVASLSAGALAAARAMFVSAHDLTALVVVVAGAGTAGVLGALPWRQSSGRRGARPPLPGNESGPWSGHAVNWWPGCPTTCVLLWPVSGPWPKRSTTAW